MDLSQGSNSIPLSEYIRNEHAYYERLYADSLGLYRDFLYEGIISEDASDLRHFYDRYADRENLNFGYQFYDIDGDGSKELLIYDGYFDPDSSDKMDGVVHILTLEDDGTPLTVYSGETIKVHEGNILVTQDDIVYQLTDNKLEIVTKPPQITPEEVTPDWTLLGDPDLDTTVDENETIDNETTGSDLGDNEQANNEPVNNDQANNDQANNDTTVTEPEVVEPEVVESEIVEPEIVEPEIVEPEIVEPEIVEPEIVEPEIVEPDIVEPDIVEPDIVEPDIVEPDIVEPEIVEPEIVEPDIVEPDIVEPEVTEPDTTTPDTSKPGTSYPGTSYPGTSNPGTSTPDTSTPDTSTPDTSTPDTSTPDTSTPDTSTPDTSTPEEESSLALTLFENLFSGRTFGASGYRVPEEATDVFVSLSNLTMLTAAEQDSLFNSIKSSLPSGKTAVRTSRDALLASGYTFVNANGVAGTNEIFLNGAYFTEIIVTNFTTTNFSMTMGGVTYTGTFDPLNESYNLSITDIVYPK